MRTCRMVTKPRTGRQRAYPGRRPGQTVPRVSCACRSICRSGQPFVTSFWLIASRRSSEPRVWTSNARIRPVLANQRWLARLPVSSGCTARIEAAGPRTSTVIAPWRRRLRELVVERDPPPRDDDHPPAHGFDLRQDVRRKQDRVLCCQLADHVANFADLNRVQPGRRLVEDQDLRVVHHRLGQARPAAGTRAKAAR